MNLRPTLQPYTHSVNTWHLTLTETYSSPPSPLTCLLSALLRQLPRYLLEPTSHGAKLSHQPLHISSHSHSWRMSTLTGDQISHNRHEARPLLSKVTVCMNIFMLVVESVQDYYLIPGTQPQQPLTVIILFSSSCLPITSVHELSSGYIIVKLMRCRLYVYRKL